jgi:hypothetical protein
MTLSMVNLTNGGHLNRVFEQMGLAYAPQPLPRTEAFQTVKEKRKAEVLRKPVAKMVKAVTSRVTRSKTAALRKIRVVKMVRLRIKIRVHRMSEIELALTKLVGVSKKFCLLDAPSSSHGPHGRGVAKAKTGE